MISKPILQLFVVIFWFSVVDGSFQTVETRFKDTNLYTEGFIYNHPDKRGNLPRPLVDLITEATSDQKYDFSEGCKLGVTSSNEKLVIEANEADCPTKTSLKIVIDALLPDVSLDDASNSFICSECYFFTSLEFEKSTKLITFQGTGKETIRLMDPGYFKLFDANLTVSFKSETVDLSLSDLNINLVGFLSIKGHEAIMTIKNLSGKTKFSFDIVIRSVLLRDLAGLFGIHMDRMVKPISGFTIAPYKNVIFVDSTITGTFSGESDDDVMRATALQMVAVADVSHSVAFVSAKMYLVIDKKRSLPAQAAIIAAVSWKFNVLDQIKRFITYKEFIPQLSIIRKLNRDYLIIVSQSDIMMVNDASFIQSMAPYMKDYETYLIREGFSVQVLMPLKENLQNCSSDIKVSDIPDEVLITIQVRTSGLQWIYPDRFKADMKSVLHCIDPQIASQTPSEIIKDENSLIEIKDMIFGMGKKFTVTAVVHGPFDLAGGLIVLGDIDLQAERLEKDKTSWKFSGKANVKIGFLEVNVTIEKEGSNYTVTGSIDSLMMSDIENVTGNSIFFTIISMFGPLKNFGMKNLKVIAKFGGEKSLRIIGQPILFGIKDLYMEIIIYKQKETTEIVTAFVLRDVQLDKLLEDICGRRVLADSWITKLTVYLIISSVNDEKTKFTLSDLAEVPIEKGLSIKAMFRLPHDCKGNSLCKFLKDKMGLDASFYIGGRIDQSNGMWLFELVAGIKGTITIIPRRLTLASIDFKISINGKNSKIVLSCQLLYQNPEQKIQQLRFRGAISVSLSGELSFDFTMAGMWLQPFGLSRIGVGNLHLGVGLKLPSPIPKFEFGGEVWIGKLNLTHGAKNANVLKIKCYFGFDPTDPTNNYIFASVNKLTIASLFRAFQIKATMPKVVAESGFPEGLTISFTSNPDGKAIEGLDQKLPPGFFLKGTINIMGYTVSAAMTLNSKIIKVDISFSPLSIGNGLIRLQRSDTDDKNGPKCFVYITENSVKVNIEGYVSVLGMSNYVLIDVTDTGYKFNTTSDMFGVLRTELFVQASYGAMPAAQFKFIAKLKFSLKKIAEEIKKYLDKIGELAKESFERAQKSLDAAKDKVSTAKNKVDQWKADLNSFRERNKKRIAELEKKKAAMKENCKAKCGTTCVGFLDWKSECFKIMWWWCGCPVWNSCKWKIPDIICIAKCEITKAFNKVAASIEQFGLKLANAVSNIGDFFLDMGKGVIDIGDKVLDLAKGIMKGVEFITAVGLEIAKAVTTIVLEKLLEVRKLNLYGSFNSSLTACMGLDCDVTLLGLDIKFESQVCVNLEFFNSLAALLTSKKYPGVEKLESKIESEEDKYKELDSKEKTLQSEVDKGENKINSDVRDAEKRSWIPSAAERNAMEYNAFPEYVMKRSDIMEILSHQSPWALADKVNPEMLHATPVKADTTIADKRTLEGEVSSDSCQQLRSFVLRYEEIVNGLQSTYQNLKDQTNMYDAYNNKFTKGVDDIKRDIDNIEKRYNITNEEKEDFHFWYKTVKDGHDRWQMKANNIARHQQRFAIPKFKDQLDYIFKKSFDQDIVSYLDTLHHKAKQAYERSSISSVEAGAQKQLGQIKKDLVEIISSKKMVPRQVNTKVQEILSNIKKVKRKLIGCRHKG